MRVYGLTDIGRSRSQNQDYVYFSSDPVGVFPNLLLVADGMGGHKAGDYASGFAVENFIVYGKLMEQRPLISVLREGISKVNGELFERTSVDENLKGAGTTLVAATVEEDTLYVANVGDSRLYIFREGKLKQITRDHSYVEELVALGQIERGSQEYLEKKNIITRAVGTEPGVHADIFDEQLMAGDLICLCSDGLYNMVPEEELCRCLSSTGSLREKVEQLVSSANEHGGKDNITIILADPQVREVAAC